MKILVIDTADITGLLQHFLSNSALSTAEVLVANTQTEAVPLVTEVDAIIVDIALNNFDIFYFMAHVRKFIILTGRVSYAQVESAQNWTFYQRLGGTDVPVVIKPHYDVLPDLIMSRRNIGR